MKKQVTLLVAGIALIFGAKAVAAETAGSGTPMAAESMPGKALVEKSCVGCHGDEVYTAKTRKITSIEGLKKQVAACSDAARTGWTEAQKADVVNFLNSRYYKFK